MSAPDPFVLDDAAYVLGALGPSERRAYEAHLTTCPRCREAVAELSGLPGLLAQVPADRVTAPPAAAGPLPDTVLPGLVARVRRDRRRRRLVAAGAALAAACLVVALVLSLGGRSPAVHRDGVLTALSPVRPVPVTATVRFQPVAWGTRVEVTCRYAGRDVPAPGGAARTYRLVVLPAGGRPAQSLADWESLPGKDVVADGSTALHLDEVASVELQDADGTVLLQGAPPG